MTDRRPSLRAAFTNLQVPMPLGRKLRLMARNDWIRIRTGSNCTVRQTSPNCPNACQNRTSSWIVADEFALNMAQANILFFEYASQMFATDRFEQAALMNLVLQFSDQRPYGNPNSVGDCSAIRAISSACAAVRHAGAP